MTRIRLRESRQTAEAEAAFYRQTYPDGYRHDVWEDHVERVAASVDLIRRYAGRITTAADLSCGDGAILHGLAACLDRVWLGDLNTARIGGHFWTGAAVEVLPPALLPDSLASLPEPVDLFVLSETIEHVDDPDALLRAIRKHARHLFLSTPVDEQPFVRNLEHYWSWGVADMRGMLQDTGWDPLELKLLTPESTRHMPGAYTFQLWMAVAR